MKTLLNAFSAAIYKSKAKRLERENKELKQKYDELNDFSNSQVAKLLEEVAGLKKEYDELKYKSNARHLNYLREIHEQEKIIKRYEGLENWVADYIATGTKTKEDLDNMRNLISDNFFKKGEKNIEVVK